MGSPIRGHPEGFCSTTEGFGRCVHDLGGHSVCLRVFMKRVHGGSTKSGKLSSLLTGALLKGRSRLTTSFSCTYGSGGNSNRCMRVFGVANFASRELVRL